MKHQPLKGGFTLLELLTVMAIIVVLMALLLPAMSSMRARAEKAQCINNLRSLYVAASAYVGQNNHWPQVDVRMIQSNRTGYALAWIESLRPFGISRKNWICPTTQILLSAPDYEDDKNARVDYRATPFDSNPETPYKWAKQPWFIEAGDVHGNGQTLIMTDGGIHELNDMILRKSDRLRPVGQ